MTNLKTINNFLAADHPGIEVVEVNVKGENRTYHYCISRNGKLGDLYETLDEIFEFAINVCARDKCTTNDEKFLAMFGVYTPEQRREAENHILSYAK